MVRFGYSTFNKWVVGQWKRPEKGMPKGAKAAIIDLIQKFGSDKHKLANLPVRARAIMDAKRATTNNSETKDK